MTAVRPLTYNPPTWLQTALFILSLLNLRATGPLLLLQSQEHGGIAVDCRDGRTLRIWATALRGFEQLLTALQRAGVPGSYNYVNNTEEGG
jgi:hypothetical protein